MSYGKYPQYKESGLDWLGHVPKHWEVLSIKRLTPVARGASPRPIEDPKYFDDEGEYAWVRIADVTSNNHYLKETTQRLSDLGKSLSVSLEPGSLFLSIAGSVGKPMITHIKACIHDGFVYFPQLEVNFEFLYYIFESGQSYLGLGKFGTQLNLNTDTVGGIKLGLPPREEQDAIAAFLDWKTGQIDVLIARKKELLEKLKEKRIAFITHAVTKGFNSTSPMSDSGVSWLGQVPKHWEVKRLKFIFPRLYSGVSVNSDNTPSLDGSTAILKTSSVYGNRFKPEENKRVVEDELDRVACPVTQDSLIISRMNTPELVGNCGYVDRDYENLFLPDRLWIARFLNHLEAHGRFAWYLVTSHPLVSLTGILATGTSDSMKNLTQEAFLDIPVGLPPYAEQVEIASRLDFETAKLDLLEEKVTAVIDRLTEYRTALITAATTGKIDVRKVKISGSEGAPG